MSENKKNLHQRILDVMQTMGAIKKGGTAEYGDKYAYHKIDDIDDKLRHALVEHGVTVVVAEIKDRKLESYEEADKYRNIKTKWYAECLIVLELTNADDPSDTKTIQGWGQGLDSSDKATGKAISYAAKSAYLSAFHLRGQPDNEQDDIQRSTKQASKPVPEEPPEEVQAWLDAIRQADNIEDLNAVGDNLKNEAAAVQNAVRSEYAKRLKSLKQLAETHS